MKFVALALALVLAVGSHAASMQADAPSQLAHIRTVMDLYLVQVKDSAKKALDQLDGTDYSDLKVGISQRLEDVFTQIKTLQASVGPVTDGVVGTLSETTSGIRASIMADIDSLKKELEPKRVALQEVIDRHIADYKTRMEPIIHEYAAKHTSELESLKVKMEPIVEEMRVKIALNVEETKAAMMPMVDAVRTKLFERLEVLKTQVTPFVEEYKEYIKNLYASSQSMDSAKLADLKAQIVPLVEAIKLKFTAIFETIVAAYNKH
ncbi:apolipoprotein A-I-like [Pseudochaenichthys georgianus]|uniref:apolipoprotein A-I-like n=1 Tax=Pseudochaenichthys georgianus TaxID=52239 RepID=UPI00146D227D|nr:apolipoprotein A-I-like [Pseudochaenichthys georgianus]